MIAPTLSAKPKAETAISLRGISKTYTIWDDPSARLLAPLWRLIPGQERRATPRRFTALHEMSLEVNHGECIGIIGRNGAGKSTLLQLIAGTLQPTTGFIGVRGRVAALLELGSGFNPEFTGRENVYLNATIMGMTRPEIDARFEEIVEYSGIREFIDRPVRTYSSGMTLRLAFSVCAHVDAEIIIVDEALAVGDARFQFKCFATLNQFLASGKTIIFVSHDTNSVKRLCTSAILLEQGELLLKGDPNDVVNIYTKLVATPHGRVAIEADLREARAKAGGASARAAGNQQAAGEQNGIDDATRLLVEERSHQQISDKEYAYGGDRGRITSVLMTDEGGTPRLGFVAGDIVQVQLVCESAAEISDPIYAVTIKDVRGQEIFGTNTYFRGDQIPSVTPGIKPHVTFRLKLNLMPGVYFLSAGWVRLAHGEVEVIQRRYDVIRFEMMARDRSFGIAYCENHVEVR